MCEREREREREREGGGGSSVCARVCVCVCVCVCGQEVTHLSSKSRFCVPCKFFNINDTMFTAVKLPWG